MKDSFSNFSYHIYRWYGKTTYGSPAHGEQIAVSAAHINTQLRQQGIIPIKIIKKRGILISLRNKKISTQDIAAITQQLTVLLSASIPIVQALELMGRDSIHIGIKKLLAKIKLDIESGSTLAEALAKYPKYFNALYCHLVAAGEQSGTLEKLLACIALYKEKMTLLKNKIKKIIIYPLAVFIMAMLVTIVLLIFVVPQFETLFTGFGVALPLFTRLVIYSSRCLQHYGWWSLLIFGLIGWGISFKLYRMPNFAQLRDRMLLKLPILGKIIKHAVIARFTRTLALTFSAGLPIITSLKAVAGATGNVIYHDATLSICNQITSGQSLQYAMRTTALFPEKILQMVLIGEESGNLAHMLNKGAELLETDVDNAVASLSSLIEPFIMVVLGIVVGSLVIAMYLPIFQLGSIM